MLEITARPSQEKFAFLSALERKINHFQLDNPWLVGVVYIGGIVKTKIVEEFRLEKSVEDIDLVGIIDTSHPEFCNYARASQQLSLLNKECDELLAPYKISICNRYNLKTQLIDVNIGKLDQIDVDLLIQRLAILISGVPASITTQYNLNPLLKIVTREITNRIKNGIFSVDVILYRLENELGNFVNLKQEYFVGLTNEQIQVIREALFSRIRAAVQTYYYHLTNA